MNEHLIELSVPLARGESLRIEDGRDMLIHLWQGNAWITQEGDPRDVELSAGKWFRVTRDGRTMLTAWSDTVLALTSPHEQRAARVIEVLERSVGRASGTRPRAAARAAAPAGAMIGTGLAAHGA